MISSIASASAYETQQNFSRMPKVSNLLNPEKLKKDDQPVDTFESGSTNTAVDAKSNPVLKRSSSSNSSSSISAPANLEDASMGKTKTTEESDKEFREVFHKFVGASVFGQMLKSMRQTQQKPAYFDGGQAEEMFQQQLDQVIVDKITAASPSSLSSGMIKQMEGFKTTARIMG